MFHLEAQDNQTRFEVAQFFREHLRQVYADRSLEEWLQAWAVQDKQFNRAFLYILSTILAIQNKIS